MFDRFSDEARRVVAAAQSESRSLNHNYLGTEHLLLGLAAEPAGVVAQALKSLRIDLNDVREGVLRVVGRGAERPHEDAPPFTPQARQLFVNALREALALAHRCIRPEHLLLAISRLPRCKASHVLLDLGLDLNAVRGAMVLALPAAEGTIIADQVEVAPIEPVWFSGAGPLLTSLADEIRLCHHRDPDVGDLLLVLASLRHSLVADLLDEVGLDMAALRAAIERVRSATTASEDKVYEEITALRRASKRALEADQFDRAAKLQNREYELLRARAGPAAGDLIRIRDSLGLPLRS